MTDKLLDDDEIYQTAKEMGELGEGEGEREIAGWKERELEEERDRGRERCRERERERDRERERERDLIHHSPGMSFISTECPNSHEMDSLCCKSGEEYLNYYREKAEGKSYK